MTCVPQDTEWPAHCTLEPLFLLGWDDGQRQIVDILGAEANMVVALELFWGSGRMC